MKKMVVWFHSFPDEPEVIIDKQLFEQINVSAFMVAEVNQKARMLFNGHFNGFIDFVSDNHFFDNVEIVMPAKEVLYTKVSVPSKSKNRILQALPFLLDDSLINDIDKQFFALGEVKFGQCSIAIISRFVISKVFEQFKKLALPVSVMTSELFKLPWYQDKWTIAFVRDDVFIRTGPQSGLMIAINNIDFAFQVLINNTLSQEVDPELQANNKLPEQILKGKLENNTSIEKPKAIIIYTQKKTGGVEKIKEIAQKHLIDTEIVKGNLLKFALLENNTARKKNKSSENRGINLLQGEYHPSALKQVKIPFFKTLIAVFLLWLSGQVFFMGYQWYVQKNTLTELDSKLEQLYFETFPESKKLIDVRMQTENKLKHLQKNSTAGDSFLNLIALVGDEIRRTRGVTIKALRYNEGVLQLDVLSKGFVFNSLKSILQKKHGLIVEEKSSSRIKGEVHSTLNFRMNNS